MELADPWTAREESRLRERRGHDRQRAAGAGPDHELVFTDRVIATLVVLRFQLPHAALAVFYGVDRSTITRAVHEVRPLLAAPCSPPAVSLSPMAPTCGFAPWLMSSPTPPPTVWNCGSTVPRSVYAAPGRTSPAAGRSSPAR
ncbi:helix-turn-helix domain-containing protein [Streptomyces sp. CA-106131]|uniref:helix-turn-helix domain-containing protein n=1 Tax=Streptomyces sp. CA-106131 TaxID=3240045 RepID=UPI003D8A4DB4